jgi:hypothetical protein
VNDWPWSSYWATALPGRRPGTSDEMKWKIGRENAAKLYNVDPN